MNTMGGKPQPKIDGFTPEQRFFLSFGQIWCENEREEALRLQVQTDPHSPPRVPRERRGAEHAGVSEGVLLQGGAADGERERLPRLVDGDGGNPPGGFEQHYLT